MPRQATDAEIETILGWTHSLWGDDTPFDAYLARTRRALASPWGHANYRFVIAHNASGEPVSACKRYMLEVEIAGQPASALGFGAVVTRPEHRGAGHAGQMLSALMAEAREEGVAIALLFSDIGPALYAALGFTPLAVTLGKAPDLAGPAPFGPWPDDRPVPAAWHAASPFRILRTPDYWSYALARIEAAPIAWLPDGPDGPVRGFAVVRADEDALWIDDAGHAPDAAPAAFWQDLRALAGARGATGAAGWLPAAAELGGFTRSPLVAPLTMVAPLAGTLPPADSHLWAIDHF